MHRLHLALAMLLTLAVGCGDPVAPSAAPAAALLAESVQTGVAPVRLVSRVAPDRCADVMGGATERATPLITWSCHDGENQRFRLLASGEIGYAGLCLDAAGGGGHDLDPVIVWPCHGGANQRWYATDAGEIRGINGKCLDVYGGDQGAGARLIIYECHGGANQQWERRATPSAGGGESGLTPVRVVTFGDSNTDIGWSGTDPERRARAYVADSPLNRLAPSDANSEYQLAGKIERRWQAVRREPIRVVNHAIAGTTSGGGGFGGPDRNGSGSPNARTVVGGVTRFEGEVLGRGYPWLGGEPYGPLPRVNAFVPDAASFAYVSIGTNDAFAMPPWQTLDNLEWMVRTWVGAGQAADRIVLTTLAPGNHYDRDLVPAVNAGIRALAARTGAGVIDLAAFTSPDDGRSWRHAGLHIGDELHYSEAVRDWLAAEMVAHMQPRVR